MGKALATKAQGLGITVIGYDPYVSAEVIQGLGVKPSEFETLLAESDYVSVHAALTTDNRYMFGEKQFSMMKSTAYFINTARGGLVNEDALHKAIVEGRISGAGLDVLESEPPNQDNPLLSLDNVILTPHSSQYSDDALVAAPRLAAADIVSVLNGRWPRSLLNPQVKHVFNRKWNVEQEHSL
jgi:D-3-phosphoglycerate dehydrogenase